MVRVFIKGGVWKNSEDEILKAAIMKYGKQQWARVASLLNRKSAKQCKARWNEWLDPSVKKVEWSREEEEKLLHLAKLMPSQWRTIGSLLNGRSATQCQEHYERLLDDAVMNQQNQTVDGVGGAGVAVGAASAAAAAGGGGGAEGLRRHTLRPGDIDSHPETKPARPDPIDMDEDEIEMLQEARARLANTQGKKAKRKQREKILNEAKRLADLQKRRELKQAGLMSGKMRKRSRGSKREIDLGVEIPFHKPAPAGFHNVELENSKAEKIRQDRLKKVNFKQINEANYRSRDREAAMAQKKEENRLRSLERSNAALAVQKVSQKNDPLQQRKRGVLNMPAPTISDDELLKVAKLAKLHQKDNLMLPPPNRTPSTSTNQVTEALLGDYSDRPLPTPMRTPALDRKVNETPASRVQSSLREASQMRMMERGQTPLLSSSLGDENDNHDDTMENQANLPMNIGATPRIEKPTNLTDTPLDRSTINQTPSASSIMTPRDQLGLNRPNMNIPHDDSASVALSAFSSTIGGGGSTIATNSNRKRSLYEIAREERKAAKRARAELEAALKALPAPQFEYELAVPEVSNDEDDNEMEDLKQKQIVKDASDVVKEELEKMQKAAEKAYEAQSTVLKRTDLPRPHSMMIPEDIVEDYRNAIVTDYSFSSKDPFIEAAKLISNEMMVLVQHDAFANPPEINSMDTQDITKKKKKDKKTKKKKHMKKPRSTIPNVLDLIPDDQLETAKHLLEKETQILMKQHQDRQRLELVKTRNENDPPLNDDMIMDELKTKNIQSSITNADHSSMILTQTSSDDDTPKWVMRQPMQSKSFSKDQRLSALKIQFQALKDSSAILQKRSEKVRAKLNIKHGGYVKRISDLSQSILQSFAEMQHSKIEEYVYSNLLEKEEQEIWDRSVSMQKDIDELQELENVVKDEYEMLLEERDRLWSMKHSKV